VQDSPHTNQQRFIGPEGPERRNDAYTIEGAGERLGGIGRTTVYGLIASGQLEAMKLGSRTLVTAASIEALLASLPRVVTKAETRRKGAAR
jgi:excisionase family DNA binding protein